MAKGRTPKNRLQGAALREFRRNVAKLKHAGGVSKRVDARKQRPTRYMTSKVKRLEPVLRGEAVLVPRKKLRPDILADYERTHGREGRNVVIRKQVAEKVHVRRGMPELERVLADTGEKRVVQKRIPIPVDIENFDEFISSLENNPDFWETKRGDFPPWVFGFTIGGGRSVQLYESAAGLAASLNEYRKFEEENWFDESWDEFVLYAVDIEKYGRWHTPKKKRRGYRRRQYKPLTGYRREDERVRKQRYRAALSDQKRAEIKARDNAAHKAARERRRDNSNAASVRRLPK